MKRVLGYAMHALSCAAGYNIRWHLQALARGALLDFFVSKTLHGDLTRWPWALLATLQSSLDALLMIRLAR